MTKDIENIERYVKFHHPTGNLFHYCHFIVDGVLPLLSVYQSDITLHTTSKQTLTLVLEDCMDNHFGGFQTMLLDIYPKLRLKYVPKSVMNSIPPSEIRTVIGLTFGPYRPSDISSFDGYIASLVSIPTPLADPSFSQNLVLCIERGFQPLSLPSKFGADLNDTGTRRRHLRNHSEAVQLLQQWAKEKGLEFQNVKLEGMTWREQRTLFQRARLLFAQHGAGMANIVFCIPNSETVILEASPCWVKCFENLAKVKNLRHHYIQGNNSSCSIQSLKDTLSIL
jgi:hypothetical protein